MSARDRSRLLAVTCLGRAAGLARYGWALGLALLVSCGGGGGGAGVDSPAPETPPVNTGDTGGTGGTGGTGNAPLDAPVSCAPADQRDWLQRYLKDRYYWNDRLAAPNTSADSMDGFFRSMLYVPTDRFSYSQAAGEFNQFFGEGRRTGYGYSLVWADAEGTALLVRSVEPQSPVAKAGLARGDRVVQIDQYPPLLVGAGLLPRVTTEGVPRSFVVEDPATGQRRRIEAVSANFALTPVPVAKVLDLPTPHAPQGSQKVAYLAYHEFIVASETGLDRAFTQFNQAGATELVLDLRYNGGGSVLFARALASMIGGQRLEGQTFADVRFNTNHADANLTLTFTTNVGILPGPVLEGLKRVVVIASSDTASASELVINALRPFMPVVLVGQTTYGKPYGFSPKEACDRVYNAVSFESFNAQGTGGYTQGFAPTCEVEDDLAHALGDAAERRLAAALHYLAQGRCPVPALSPANALARAKRPGAGAGAAPALPPLPREGPPPQMLLR